MLNRNCVIKLIEIKAILMKYFNFALAVALTFLMSMNNAYAYLDPGTGSILIQGIIAAIAGGLFTIRMYWQKVKDFFNKDSSSNEDVATDSDSDDTFK